MVGLRVGSVDDNVAKTHIGTVVDADGRIGVEVAGRCVDGDVAHVNIALVLHVKTIRLGSVAVGSVDGEPANEFHVAGGGTDAGGKFRLFGVVGHHWTVDGPALVHQQNIFPLMSVRVPLPLVHPDAIILKDKQVGGIGVHTGDVGEVAAIDLLFADMDGVGGLCEGEQVEGLAVVGDIEHEVLEVAAAGEWDGLCVGGDLDIQFSDTALVHRFAHDAGGLVHII